MSIAEDKRELRARIRSVLGEIDPDDRAAMSAHLVLALQDHEAWTNAKHTLIYLGDETEPSVDRLADCQSEGRAIAAPRINWDTGAMRAVVLTGSPGRAGVTEVRRHGIREPVEGPEIAPGDLDLVLMPGIAFDRSGGRLGRGGGFYDRFLARLSPTTTTIGICFGCQVVDRIPREDHDAGVDMLVTERGVEACRDPDEITGGDPDND